MGLTQTESVGFIRLFLELLVRYASAIQAAGVAVREFEETLMKKLANAVAANARQEFLKAELKQSTSMVETTVDDLYRTGSGYLDAVIGVLGKNTPEAEAFRRLRSRVRMPGDQTVEVTAPGGTPPAAIQ